MSVGRVKEAPPEPVNVEPQYRRGEQDPARNNEDELDGCLVTSHSKYLQKRKDQRDLSDPQGQDKPDN